MIYLADRDTAKLQWGTDSHTPSEWGRTRPQSNWSSRWSSVASPLRALLDRRETRPAPVLPLESPPAEEYVSLNTYVCGRMPATVHKLFIKTVNIAKYFSTFCNGLYRSFCSFHTRSLEKSWRYGEVHISCLTGEKYGSFTALSGVE